jgi:integrase
MPLTDIAVKSARPDPSRTLRLKDEKGLYLEISPKGGKWWRLRYWIKGRENRLSLGVYPDVTLKDARNRRDDARRLISQGLDPSAVRKGEQTQAAEDALTFEVVAREWFSKRTARWTDTTAEDIIRRLERSVFPALGCKPLRQISAPDILVVIRQFEARGHLSAARRALQYCGQIFRYAVASGLVGSDPTPSLHDALQSSATRHHPTLTDPKDVGILLRSIDGYQGSIVTRCALRLAPLTFVRPGELRNAEWAEIDVAAAEWRIPASKMKMKTMHIVPLALQALAVLEELHPFTGSGRFVFPGERTATRPMSENTVGAALRGMGFTKGQMTGHGFRSMASTLLNEQGYNRDWIERQLAHAERNGVRAAYNYAEFMPERRKMMQAWADYLDGLREAGAK